MSDVIIQVPSTVCVVQQPVSFAVVINRGEKGDPGSGGGGGGQNEINAHNISTTAHQDLRTAIGNKASPYTHVQSTMATSWTINHGLGRMASITTYDSSGLQVFGRVVANGLNTSSVVFGIAISGIAYCI